MTPAADLLAVGAHDVVAGQQAVPLRRLALDQFIDNRGQLPRCEAEILQYATLFKQRGLLSQRRQQVAFAARAVTHRDSHRILFGQAGIQQRHHGTFPGRCGRAADADNLVTASDTGLFRQGSRYHVTDHGPQAGNTGNEHQPVGGNGKQEIEQRAGNNHGDAGCDRLAVEGAFQFVRGDLSLALIQHLDISAERQGRHHQLGIVGTEAALPERFAEADGKAQHLDPEATRHPEVAKLVYGYQDADGNNECCQ